MQPVNLKSSAALWKISQHLKRNPPIFLHDGDVAEGEIEGIAMLKSPVLRNE
jgi:2-keto-4-pentenoate hydratase/2-oxohepta-3-ene-1,7-dioic acid hydratase in catechol pathway